jgi:hypothetical protein
MSNGYNETKKVKRRSILLYTPSHITLHTLCTILHLLIHKKMITEGIRYHYKNRKTKKQVW